MTDIVGGLRQRLILDSFRKMTRDALGELDWFDPGRSNLPITLVSRSYKMDEEVPLNTICIAETHIDDEPAELGSLLAEDAWEIYIDFYAEDDALGRHVMGDLRDIYRGKMTAAGRAGPQLTVYDQRVTPTPTELFTCDIIDVQYDKAQNFPHPWQQHWFVCRVDLLDVYGTDA